MVGRENLLRFLKVAAHYNIAVNYLDQTPDTYRAYKDGACISPSQPNGDSIPSYIREQVRSAGLEEWQEHQILVQPGPIFVPLEPMDYSDKGKGLLLNGIGRVARPEILRAFWDVFSFLKKHGRFVSEFQTGFEEDMEKLLQDFPQEAGRYARAFEGLGRIPVDYAKLPVFEALESTSFSKNNTTFEKRYTPALRIIALEQCNRACSHCAALATVRRPRMRYTDFLACMERLKLSDEVSLSYGEPFLWSDTHEGRMVTIADLASIIAGPRFKRHLEIVTSGIDPCSEKERMTAEMLAGLPSKTRQRIRMTLTASDYPRFRLEGLSPAEAARKVQKDTVGFACKAGIRLTYLSFLGYDQLQDELLLPAASSMFPDREDFVVSCGFKRERQSEAPIGRSALNTGNHMSAETLSREAHRRCLSTESLRSNQKIDLFNEREAFKQNPDGTYDQDGELALTGDGLLVPGCCTFISTYAVIADLKRDCDAEIRQKTSEFIHRLDRLRQQGKLDCMACVASAERVRHPRLLRKAFGDEVANRCLRRASK